MIMPWIMATVPRNMATIPPSGLMFRHDNGKIMARSWQNHGKIMAWQPYFSNPGVSDWIAKRNCFSWPGVPTFSRKKTNLKFTSRNSNSSKGEQNFFSAVRRLEPVLQMSYLTVFPKMHSRKVFGQNVGDCFLPNILSWWNERMQFYAASKLEKLHLSSFRRDHHNPRKPPAKFICSLFSSEMFPRKSESISIAVNRNPKSRLLHCVEFEWTTNLKRTVNWQRILTEVKDDFQKTTLKLSSFSHCYS